MITPDQKEEYEILKIRMERQIANLPSAEACIDKILKFCDMFLIDLNIHKCVHAAQFDSASVDMDVVTSFVGLMYDNLQIVKEKLEEKK